MSSGTISCAGDTRVQTPRSSASRRTIQRRNRFSRLQRAARRRPREEVARRRAASGRGRRPLSGRGPARASRSCRAPAATSSAPALVALEEEAFDRAAARSSICRSIHSSATRSAPRVQRWTSRRTAAPRGADRTGGRRPPARAPSPRAPARSTAARCDTRPNASAAAQKPTTSRSSSPREPPDDLDRIGGRIRMVELGVEPIERRLQIGESADGPTAHRQPALQSWVLHSVLCNQYDSVMRALAPEIARAPAARARACSRPAVTSICGARCPTSTAPSTVAGLSAPVDIVRDADAIPHIFASNEARRAVRPRLRPRPGSAVADGVPAADRPRPAVGDLRRRDPRRRIGFSAPSASAGRRARRWAAMPDVGEAAGRRLRGRRQRVHRHPSRRALPPEFTLLRFEPEPWTPVDVVVWVKMMAWDLSAQLLVRAAASRPAAARSARRGWPQLMPPYPTDGLSISRTARDTPAGSGESSGCGGPGRSRRPGSGRLPQRAACAAFVAALCRGLSPVDPRSCSSAAHRVEGARLEQLGGGRHADRERQAAARQRSAPRRRSLPSHLVSRAPVGRRLRRDRRARCPGTPAVALGRNRFIAWGATNVAADVEDLYRERLDAGGTTRRVPRRARSRSRSIPETILVKGAAPVHARRARHAPRSARLGRDQRQQRRTRKRTPKPPPLEPLAFRWTALDPDDATLAAFLQAERGAQLGRVHGRAARLRRAVAELRLRRRRRPHRLLRAGPHSDARVSGDGSRPADGWTGECRMDRLGSVRRAAARLRSARALHRHRQPPARAELVSATISAWSGLSPTGRSGSSTCCTG